MSTTSVRIKKKIPPKFNHKALPTGPAPHKSLPTAPNKLKNKPRSASYKRTAQKDRPNKPVSNRGNRAQTISYNTTTDKSNDGTTMTYTYRTTYYTTVPSNATHSQNAPQTILTFDSNNGYPKQESTVIQFTAANNTESQPKTVITFTKPKTKPNRSRTMSNHKPQSSYHQMLPLAPTVRNTEMEYSYADKVVLNDNRQGTIKYIGEIDINLKGEIWYGIQLTDARGQNDGSLRGQQYFECPHKYGTFVQKRNIRWLADSDESMEFDADNPNRFHIDQIVRISNKKGKAQIRCICEIDSHLKFGIELQNDMGSHSGIVNGKFYFTSGFYKGLFVDRAQLISLKNADTNSVNLDAIEVRPMSEQGRDTCDGDDEYDSDASDEEMSLSMGDSSHFLDEIELNEQDRNMLFSNILNKLKADGRNAQQSSSDSEENKADESEYGYEENESKFEIPQPSTISVPRLSLNLSNSNTTPACETSPAADPFADATFTEVENNPWTTQNNNAIETVQELKMPKIATKRMSNLATPQTGNTILTPLLSPLQTPKTAVQTPLSVDQLNADFSKFTADTSHLKEFPDSPFDANTTKREFANCATTIQLGCNNPQKLFKIVHAMVGKLHWNTRKYRSLNLSNAKIQTKLLNYDGVEEFFTLLGFEKNGNKFECDLCQPPLSVLKDALTVLTKFIQKTGKKRGMVAMIKKFQSINLDELKSDIIEAEQSRDLENKIRTPIPKTDSFSAMVQKRRESEAKHERQHIESVIAQVFTPVSEDTDTDEVCTPQPEQDISGITDISDEEDDDDHFKLGEIINSIIHPRNTDSSAIFIILLCYPLFSESVALFKCLQHRFLRNDREFVLQQKVISVINAWITHYWEEDWLGNDGLKRVFDAFVDVIIDTHTDDKYQSMADYLLDIQSSHLQNKAVPTSVNKYGFTRINKRMQKSEILFHVKFETFFKMNNALICRQITLIDFEYFAKIKSRECVGQAWKRKNNYEIAGNIMGCIDHFNRTSLWVQSRVLLCATTKHRSKIIKKFIKMCEILFGLRNFQSLYAVFAALNSTAVLRLKKAWRGVATKHLAKFEEFKVIFSSKKNMANLRKLHRETYPPMMPYIGVYLQDLFQIEEANSKTKEDGTVNFGMLIRLTNVIDQMLTYQSTRFSFKTNENVTNLLVSEFKSNQNLNEDIIWTLSEKAKKIDEKKRLFG